LQQPVFYPVCHGSSWGYQLASSSVCVCVFWIWWCVVLSVLQGTAPRRAVCNVEQIWGCVVLSVFAGYSATEGCLQWVMGSLCCSPHHRLCARPQGTGCQLLFEPAVSRHLQGCRYGCTLCASGCLQPCLWVHSPSFRGRGWSDQPAFNLVGGNRCT
jgi:hypothetical protein